MVAFLAGNKAKRFLTWRKNKTTAATSKAQQAGRRIAWQTDRKKVNRFTSTIHARSGRHQWSKKEIQLRRSLHLCRLQKIKGSQGQEIYKRKPIAKLLSQRTGLRFLVASRSPLEQIRIALNNFQIISDLLLNVLGALAKAVV